MKLIQEPTNWDTHTKVIGVKQVQYSEVVYKVLKWKGGVYTGAYSKL